MRLFIVSPATPGKVTPGFYVATRSDEAFQAAGLESGFVVELDHPRERQTHEFRSKPVAQLKDELAELRDELEVLKRATDPDVVAEIRRQLEAANG